MARMPIFMGDVPDYNVDDSGHMHIVWRDLEIVLPVNIMLRGVAGAQRAIADWEARTVRNGEVVRMGKRERLHS